VVKTDAAALKTGSWYPDTQTWVIEGYYPFKVGLNIVRIDCAGPVPHIDKFLMAPTEIALRSDRVGAWPTKPEIVTQFAELLADPKLGETQSVIWGPWLKVLGKAPAATAKPTEMQVRFDELFAQTAADSESIAARYQELFGAAESAWRSQLQADPKSQALVDPAQEALRQLLYADAGIFAPSKVADSSLPPAAQVDLKRLKDEAVALEKAIPATPETMAVSEGKPENLKVHLRGSHLTLGKEVPRRFLQVIDGDIGAVVDLQRSGRLELARWLTSPDHPLTARVLVNRVWQGHFGEGLVRSPDNFGRLGERPTHPALLDWLSRQFIESGWSIKALHRQIMLSHTYQMSSQQNELAYGSDPDNRLWWRFNRRRLEVEAIRDSMLAVAGTLDTRMWGSQLPTGNRQYVTSTANVNPVAYDGTRRAIYLPVVRSALFDVFQAFDFAEPSVENGRRETTTVAPQALFMMNSAFVSEQSRAVADTLLARTDLDDASRVKRAWEQTLGKDPSDVLLQRTLEYLDQTTREWTSRQIPETEARRKAWQSLCRTLFGANEFVYVD